MSYSQPCIQRAVAEDSKKDDDNKRQPESEACRISALRSIILKSLNRLLIFTQFHETI
jgi:hypothetical protein